MSRIETITITSQAQEHASEKKAAPDGSSFIGAGYTLGGGNVQPDQVRDARLDFLGKKFSLTSSENNPLSNFKTQEQTAEDRELAQQISNTGLTPEEISEGLMLQMQHDERDVKKAEENQPNYWEEHFKKNEIEQLTAIFSYEELNRAYARQLEYDNEKSHVDVSDTDRPASLGPNTQEETYPARLEWGRRLSEQWNKWGQEQEERWEQWEQRRSKFEEQEKLDAQSDQELLELEKRLKQLEQWEMERRELHEQWEMEGKQLQVRWNLYEQWEMERREQEEQEELDNKLMHVSPVEWKGWIKPTPLIIAEEESNQSNTSPDLSKYDQEMLEMLRRLKILRGEIAEEDEQLNNSKQLDSYIVYDIFKSTETKVEA